MATADDTKETNNEKVMREFHKARVDILLPAFRDVDQLMLSPISLTYIQAMTRAAVNDKHLKTLIMDLKILEQLQSVDTCIENFLHQRMSDLMRSLRIDGPDTKISVQNDIFYKNGDSVPEMYYTFWDWFYGYRRGKSKRCNDVINITHRDVNLFISKQSHDRIKDVISESVFDQCADFLLVNCVYFTGKWLLDTSKDHVCRKQYHITRPGSNSIVTISPFSCGRFFTGFAFQESIRPFRRMVKIKGSELYLFLVEDPSSMEYTLPNGVFQFDTYYQNLMVHHDVGGVNGLRTVTQKVNLEITDKGVTVAIVTVLSHSILETNVLRKASEGIVPTLFMIYDNIEKLIVFMATNLNRCT